MQSTDIWKEVALSLFYVLGNQVCEWNTICRMGEHARRTLSCHAGEIRPGMVVPEDVNFALVYFCFSVDFGLMRQANAVKDLLPTLSPTETRFAKYMPAERIQRHESSAALNKSITWLQDRLSVTDTIWDLVSFFDTLEQEMPDAMIDPSMSTQLHDLACMDELRVACVWSQLGVDRISAEAMIADSKDNGLPLKTLHFERKSLQATAGRRLGRLLREFCELPWPKRTPR